MADKIDRLFRIDFYPQDWIIDTMRMENIDRGIFIQIICLIYSNRGPVLNDPKWIAGVSNVSVAVAKNSIKRMVLGGFLQETEGKLTQKRTENELKLKQNHLEISAKGGRNGGGSNKKNKDLKVSDTTKPLASPSPSPNPSPTATAIEDQEGQDQQFTYSENEDFKIQDFLTGDGLMDSRVFASAGSHNLENLFDVYNNGVKKGILTRPRNPDKAFIAWIQTLSSKGKKQR